MEDSDGITHLGEEMSEPHGQMRSAHRAMAAGKRRR
jgi:hypothetical protein